MAAALAEELTKRQDVKSKSHTENEGKTGETFEQFSNYDFQTFRPNYSSSQFRFILLCSDGCL